MVTINVYAAVYDVGALDISLVAQDRWDLVIGDRWPTVICPGCPRRANVNVGGWLGHLSFDSGPTLADRPPTSVHCGLEIVGPTMVFGLYNHRPLANGLLSGGPTSGQRLTISRRWANHPPTLFVRRGTNVGQPFSNVGPTLNQPFA